MGFFDPPSKRRPDDPPDLKLAIMKEESSRAGTNYLWHPDFREYAKIPGQYPLDYESFYHNPKNKADREKHQKLLEPFRQKEGLDLLLQRHPDKKEMWSHLPSGELPFTRMSEGELVARHALRGRPAAQTPALPDPTEPDEQFSFAPKPIRVKAIPSTPWGSTRRHYVNTQGPAQNLAGLEAAANLIKAAGRLAAAQAPPASEPPIRVRAVPSTPWGSTQRHYVNTQGPAARYDETGSAQNTSGPPPDEAMETPARAEAGRASSTSRTVRDLGLGTRGVLDGLLGLGDLAAGPIRWGMNGIAELLTGNPELIRPMAGTVPDALGLPRPETGAENLAYQANAALAPLPVTYGAGSLLAGPRAAAVARPTLAAEAGRVLTEAPVAQAVSAAGSGLALGAAQNAGAGPAAQMGAALLGGAVAPKGVREAWAGEPPPRVTAQRAGLAIEEAEVTAARPAGERPNPAAKNKTPGGPDLTDYRSGAEMEALHQKLLDIKPQPENFLYSPGDSWVTSSLKAMEKYARNLDKSLGVVTRPVEIAPGQWRLRVEAMPPPTPLTELKHQMGELYDAWQRGEKGRIRLGIIGPEEAAKIKAATGLDALLNRRTLDTGDIKHAFDIHGHETKRGQISIVRSDFERYAEILTDPHWIELGTTPGSLHYLRRYPDGTMYALEHQVKGKKLEFRTMWKAAVGGIMIPILIATTGTGKDESNERRK